MIIIISPETIITNESFLVNQFLIHGLDLFHIRKHLLSDQEMKQYIEAIPEQYRHQLVLHSHYHLAQDLGITRLHFREVDRISNRFNIKKNKSILSTSVHAIQDFNALFDTWSYAFLSPFFPSISKQGYGMNETVLSSLKDRNNHITKLIALGGIDNNNYTQARLAGADGCALLGGIWQNNDPIKTFIECKTIDQLY